MVEERPESPFDAFISYRRKDGRTLAARLRDALEHYNLPRSIRRDRPRLKIYLDTAYERATEDFYQKVIVPAMERSRSIIVIATPGAYEARVDGQRNWIEREIEDFRKLPQRAESVRVVCGSGAFDGQLPGRLDEIFPNVERVDLRDFTALRFLSPRKWRRSRDELLKLIAALHGLSDDEMPLLREEESRRTQRRLVTASAVVLIVAAAMTGLWIDARHQQRIAEKRLTAAMEVADRTVLVVNSNLAQLAGGSPAQREILSTTCAMLDALQVDAVSNAKLAQSRAACAAHRAVIAEAQDNIVVTRREYQRAAALYDGVSGASALDTQAQLARVSTFLALGQMETRQNRLTDAARWLARADAVLKDRRLDQRDPEVRLALSHFHRRRGALAARRADQSAAQREYQQALSLARQLIADVKNPTTDRYLLNVADCHDLVGVTRENSGDVAGARENYEAALSIRRQLLESYPANPVYLSAITDSLRRMGDLEVADANFAAASRSFAEARGYLERLLMVDPSNLDFLQRAATANDNLGDIATREDRNSEAAKHYASAMQMRKRALDLDSNNVERRYDWYLSAHRVATAEGQAGNLDESARQFATVLPIIRELRKKHPDTAFYAVDVLKTCLAVATVARARGANADFAQAMATAQEASDAIRQHGWYPADRELDALRSTMRTMRSANFVFNTAPSAPLPTTAGDWALIARKRDQEGKLADAADAYRHAVELAPDDVDIRVSFAWVLHRSGKQADAGRQIGAAIKKNPHHSMAFVRLGMMMRDGGDPASALQALRKALDSPDGGRAHALAHQTMGDIAMSADRYADAVSEYRQAVRYSNDDAQLRNMLGWALVRNNEPQRAIPELDAALRLQPNYPLALNNRAYASAMNGDQSAALRDWKAALALPDSEGAHAFVYYNYGELARKAGRFDEAAKDYRRSIRLNPRDPWPHHSLGVALSAAGHQADAIAAFREHVRLAPTATGFGDLGTALELSGDRSGALASYQRALALDPSNDEWRRRVNDLTATP